MKIELRGHQPRHPQVHDGTQSAVKERETKRVQCARALAAGPVNVLAAGAASAAAANRAAAFAKPARSAAHAQYTCSSIYLANAPATKLR